MPRTTPLLSSKSPVVNSGAIALPILTAVGEWTDLTANETQWRKTVYDLAPVLGLDVRPKPKRELAFIVSPEGGRK